MSHAQGAQFDGEMIRSTTVFLLLLIAQCGPGLEVRGVLIAFRLRRIPAIQSLLDAFSGLLIPRLVHASSQMVNRILKEHVGIAEDR